MASIFTRIILQEIPAYILYEDENCIAFLDAFPVQKGHTLVVPKKEVDYIFDLEDKLLTHLHLVSKKLAKAIKLSFSCNRVGQAVVGLEVPHAHIHLIPINTLSDMDFNNDKLKLTPNQFEEIKERIKANIC